MIYGRILLLVVSLLVSLDLAHHIPRDVSYDVDPVANLSDSAASNLEAFTKADLSTRTHERLTRRTRGGFRTAKEINADPIRQRTSVSPQSLYDDVALAIRLVRETKIEFKEIKDEFKEAKLLCVKIFADGKPDAETGLAKPVVWGPNSKNRIEVRMEVTAHTRKFETSPTIIHRHIVVMSTIGATRQWGSISLRRLETEYIPGRFPSFDWSHMKDEMNVVQLQELVRSSNSIQGLHLLHGEQYGPYTRIAIWRVPDMGHLGPTVSFEPSMPNCRVVNVDLATWRVFTTITTKEEQEAIEERHQNRVQSEWGFRDYSPHTHDRGPA